MIMTLSTAQEVRLAEQLRIAEDDLDSCVGGSHQLHVALADILNSERDGSVSGESLKAARVLIKELEKSCTT